MFKYMFKIMWYDFRAQVRKNKESFRGIAWVEVILLARFCSGRLAVSGYDWVADYGERGPSVLSQSVTFIMVLFLLGMIINVLPLRLPKALYVCAAGEKEKKNYIVTVFGFKLIFSAVILFGCIILLEKKVFLSSDIGVNLIHFLLFLSILVCLNLKAGSVKMKDRETDERGYEIITKEEEMVNEYWFALLIVQVIAFYFMLAYETSIPPMVWYIGGGAVMAWNFWVAFHYGSGILRDACAYERAYCQLPERPRETYDF